MKVWLNGQIVDAKSAQISALDASVQHGVGLFETLLARAGRPHRLEQHLERIAESARALGLSPKLDVDLLADAVMQTIAAAEPGVLRVRLTITGGDLNLLKPGQSAPPTGTVLITAQSATTYPEEFFARGIAVTLADHRLSPLDPTAGHKTINYWGRLRALQEAGLKGAAEALWFSITNHLMGGSVSNVFLVKGEMLHTPIARGEEQAGALPSPVLPGIIRQAVIEFAAAESMRVEKRMLGINDLLAAEEVFLTNSSWGVLPVVRVERESIGDGAVGSTTRKLRQRWLEDLSEGGPSVVNST